MTSPTRLLQAQGQSLWLDPISGPLLKHGGLRRAMDVGSVTGVTFSAAMFDQAAAAGAYDDSIGAWVKAGVAGEDLLLELALTEVSQAAEVLRPSFEASEGLDGWVSLPLSPVLADTALHTGQLAARVFARAARANLLLKIPGTPEGLRAVEALVFAGVPVHVTLLFSPEQILLAAEAYLRGLERRLAEGLDARVVSVASFHVSPWDDAVRDETAASFHNRLGLAMAMRSYRAHRALLASERWRALAAAGARPQRLLWASTTAQDAAAPDTLYVQALTAPGTLISLSEATLAAFADHGQVGEPLPADAGYADAVLEEFRREGVDDAALAQSLQCEGVASAARGWQALLARLAERSSL